jgi:hypothetical protein
MDATTIMAIICSVLVFVGWLAVPAAPKTIKPEIVVSEERERVAVSA